MYDNISISFKYHQLSLWNMWISEPVVFGDHVHGLSLNQKNEISSTVCSSKALMRRLTTNKNQAGHPRKCCWSSLDMNKNMLWRIDFQNPKHFSGNFPPIMVHGKIESLAVAHKVVEGSSNHKSMPWTTCLWVENHDCLQWKAVANNQGIRCGKFEHIAIRCCCPRFQELKQ